MYVCVKSALFFGLLAIMIENRFSFTHLCAPPPLSVSAGRGVGFFDGGDWFLG